MSDLSPPRQAPRHVPSATLGDPSPTRSSMLLFGIGLAISLVMLARSQVAGDALSLLSRGWLLAAEGVWVPFGNPAATSAGGFLPGGLTALLVGLPLKIWMDHRAPVVLILLLHVAAYFLLDRIVARELGGRARILLAAVYWLNPWRLYQSAWLDNSNYVFFSGAVHLWACLRQRRAPSWIHSTLLVTVVGFTAQLHLDAVILVFAAVLLWRRGYWRPHWGGIALGTLLTALSLVPFALEAARRPEILPGGADPIGSNLLRAWPVLKGAAYWLRYASLAGSEGMNVYDFTPAVGAVADRVLAPLCFGLGRLVALPTMIPALLANVWLVRRQLRARRSPREGRPAGRAWLRGYALWVFVACLIANALSPTVVMWWHNLIVLHAAVLPLVLYADVLGRTRLARHLGRGLAVWIGLSVVLMLGMALGAEQYRHGGREAWSWVLPRNDRVVQDLHLTDHGVSIDPRHGSWPLNNELLYEEFLRPYELPPPSGARGSRARP